MCGIAGFLGPASFSADTLGVYASRMADALVHRGPDDSGVHVEPDAGLGLSFRRLAILDLSPAGHQPMSSACGRYTVIFNGEIYNFRDIRAELERDGVGFRGHSDTEVLLALVQRDGVEATLKQIWGMFAIAMYDRHERAVWLARDRVGKKPLYVGRCGSTWLFGSELKALRRHPSFSAGIDRRAVATYLRFGYVPAPHSIYEGIGKVRPGWAMVLFADGRPPRDVCYWNVADVVADARSRPVALTDGEAVDELDIRLRDAVSRRMVADVPLGAFLSGGIDSSVVVALMQAQSSRPVKTFTIGFDVARYNEAESAKAVARHLGTEHTEFYVSPDAARDVIPRIPALYDEPFADPSQMPTFLVSELTRRQVTVALSGDGGDELFGGYSRYAWATKIWRGLGVLPLPVRQTAGALIGRVPAAAWDAAYRSVGWALPRRLRVTLPAEKVAKLGAVLPSASNDQLYRRLVSQWKDPAMLTVGATEYPSVLDDEGLRDRIPSFLERMMYADFVSYLPDDILVKVDRATMGVSLEGRAPLLDHRLVEWAWRLPMPLKIRDGVSKWILRQVLYKYVPQALVDRPKMGFGVPIGEWLRGPLRDWSESLLEPRAMAADGFIDPAPVQALWQAHLSGRRNEQYRLWVILVFQSWLAHTAARPVEEPQVAMRYNQALSP